VRRLGSAARRGDCGAVLLPLSAIPAPPRSRTRSGAHAPARHRVRRGPAVAARRPCALDPVLEGSLSYRADIPVRASGVSLQMDGMVCGRCHRDQGELRLPHHRAAPGRTTGSRQARRPGCAAGCRGDRGGLHHPEQFTPLPACANRHGWRWGPRTSRAAATPPPCSCQGHDSRRSTWPRPASPHRAPAGWSATTILAGEDLAVTAYRRPVPRASCPPPDIPFEHTGSEFQIQGGGPVISHGPARARRPRVGDAVARRPGLELRSPCARKECRRRATRPRHRPPVIAVDRQIPRRRGWWWRSSPRGLDGGEAGRGQRRSARSRALGRSTEAV